MKKKTVRSTRRIILGFSCKAGVLSEFTSQITQEKWERAMYVASGREDLDHYTRQRLVDLLVEEVGEI